MKNASKKSWQALIPMFFLFAMLLPAKSGFSVPSVANITCPAPDVTITDKSSGAVSFGWSAVSGATLYKVWYYRREDHYTSSETTTGSNSIAYSSLPAGTYDFYFATICGSEESSFIVVDDLIM